MKPAALEALKDSIEHWDRVANRRASPHEGLGRESCALCEAFYYEGRHGCAGCPVKVKTGKIKCRGTPYADVYKVWSGVESLNCQYDKSFYKHAKRELKFLKSLLPKKKVNKRKT